MRSMINPILGRPLRRWLLRCCRVLLSLSEPVIRATNHHNESDSDSVPWGIAFESIKTEFDEMGASCEKQHRSPETATDIQENLVRQQQTNKFNDIYAIVGEPLGTGAISTVRKIRKKESAVGGSSQREFVKRKKRRREQKRRYCLKRIHDKSNNATAEETPNTLRSSDTYYALKEINIDKVQSARAMQFMRNEVELLKSLDHPSIVRAFETFELDGRLSIVMELCRGGDLSSRSPYSERQVAIIIRQVLSAVSYMHHQQVLHRDLKIENILYQSEDPQDFRVQLIDFGLSVKYAQSDRLRDKVGTLYTVAPETLQRGGYTDKVDCWSVGVIAYLLISGDRPFRGETLQEMATNILQRELVFDSLVWERRSPECKEFISSLLERNPDLRPDAEVALKHPWFLNHEDETHSSAMEAVLESIYESLIRYAGRNDFRRLTLNVMAKRLSSDELREVRDVFLHIDEGNDGHLTMEELKRAFKRGNKAEKGISDEEIESIFRKLDLNIDGVISWTEFVAGTMEGRGTVDEHRLADAFDCLDYDDSGRITKENLRHILGKSYSKEYVAKLMAEADITHDGKISYLEFRRALANRQPTAIEFAFLE